MRLVLCFWVALSFSCTHKTSDENNWKIDSKKFAIEPLVQGFDSIQIRIWYIPPYAPVEIPLLTIGKSDGKWTGTLRKITMGFIEDSTANKSMRQRDLFIPMMVRSTGLTPKSNWESLMKRLEELNIYALPDMAAIPNLQDGVLDGRSYTVEIAGVDYYRTYSYHVPETFAKTFQDARRMVSILELIDSELGIPWTPEDPDLAEHYVKYDSTADTLFLRW